MYVVSVLIIIIIVLTVCVLHELCTYRVLCSCCVVHCTLCVNGGSTVGVCTQLA